MPLHRFECYTCKQTFEKIVPMNFSNPKCSDCGENTRKLMPNRVGGWVMDETRTRNKMADSLASKFESSLGGSVPVSDPVRLKDESNPLALPNLGFKKSYAECTAEERDERWAETKQSMIQWQTNHLTASGVDYSEAKQRATEFQNENIPKAREGMERADGVE